MFRFFQERYPGVPENRFWLTLKITEEFIGIVQNINPIKDRLRGYEEVGVAREEYNFLNHLRPYLNQETDDVTPFYNAIYILKSILGDYHLREVAKPDNKNDMII